MSGEQWRCKEAPSGYAEVETDVRGQRDEDDDEDSAALPLMIASTLAIIGGSEHGLRRCEEA